MGSKRKPTLSDLKSVLRERRFTPSKARGQNFLYEHRVLEAIANEINPRQDDIVVEIGCGCGFLTMHLADRAKKVIAVEIDPVLTAVAEQFLSEYTNVEILQADILENGELNPLVLKRLAKEGRCGLVAGNLPYSAATAIIGAFAHWEPEPRELVFMLQEEVAQKLAIWPGERGCGALSMITHAAYQVEMLRKIGPEVFWPKPKVDSRLLRLKPLYVGRDFKLFEKFVHALFAQPRKTAVNSLITGAERADLPFTAQDPAALRLKIVGLLGSLGLDTTVRPSRLDRVQIWELFENLCRKV